ncbi:hypothetical protein CF328_g9085 [Tilletia controversa]|nr:hypothetical protein CF328_g9085 [Tilletia controversa]
MSENSTPLRIYEGESKEFVVFALALHDFESGKATAEQLKEALDNFLAAIGRAELPWRALQQSGLVLEAVSLVKLVQHRANESKDADVVSALQNLLDAAGPQLKQSVEALQAATKRIGDVAQTSRDRIRQNDSVLSVISGTAGTRSQGQKDEGTALLLGEFVENLLEKMESSLVDAGRELKTKLGVK